MKKSRAVLITIGTVSAIASFLILENVFQYSFYDLIENALVAILTGCIFAFPTVLVQSYSQKLENYENIVKILKDIKNYLQTIISQCKNIFAKDSLIRRSDIFFAKSVLKKLNNSSRALGNLVNENLEESNDISALITKLAELRSLYKRVLNKTESWGNVKNEAEKMSNECIAIIDKIIRSQ